jgi:hypothetical protein
MRYIYNILIAIDQLFNTVLGGFPDETISSRMGKRLVKRDCALCNFICGLLNLIDKNHCVKSIEADEGKTMK